MPSASYTPTTWVDDGPPPISAGNLNHLEDGVESAHERIDSLGSPTGADVGDVKMTARASAPAGWLICDGSAVNRTTYADLFAAIGTAYGTGDGSTTFNLPDLRGRAPVGKGTHADVDQLGDNEGATVSARRPKHKHTVNDPGHTHANQFQMNGGGVALQGANGGNNGMQNIPSATTGITVGPQTGNEPTDGPAYVVLNFIIKT